MLEKLPGFGGGDKVPFSDLDDEVINDAIQTLEEQGEEQSKENIEQMANYLLDIRETDEGEFKIGFVQDREEATVADQDLIAPNKIEEFSNFQDMGYLERGGRYVRILTITNWPSYVSPGIISSLYTTNANVRVSQHIEPRDIQTALKKLQKRLNRIWARVASKRERGKQDTQEEIEERDRIRNLIWAIITGKTKLFDYTLYIEIVGKDKRQLDKLTKKVIGVFARQNIRVNPTEKLMTQAQDAIAPAARDSLKGSRTLMQETNIACMFPFISPELVNPDGLLSGFDMSGKPIFFDPYELSSYIEVVAGKQGSGKSFWKKYEILLLRYIDPSYKTWVLDPQGDFRDLAEKIGGQIIKFGGDTRINPLEIRAGAVESIDSPWKNKLRTIMGMYRTYFGDEWNQTVQAVLNRIVLLSYYKYGITENPETHAKTGPIIQDHADIALQIANRNAPMDFIEPENGAYENQEEVWGKIADVQRRMSEQDAEVARYIYNAFETFQPGGINSNLNGRTNVDLDDNLVVFDLSAFADSHQAPLMMYVLLDLIYQHCTRTKNEDQVVADEAHYFLNNFDALEFLNLFARHHRHSRTRISLLTQTMSEFLVEKNDEGLREEIYKTADIKRIFHHRDVSEEAKEHHNFTNAEINYITGARQGEKSDSSECLLDITGAGKIAVEIKVSDYAKYICDEDLNPWVFLYEKDDLTARDLEVLAEEGLDKEYNVPDELFARAGVARPIQPAD